jgi:maleylacetate reductase
VLHELEIERPLVVASRRWDDLALPATDRWREVPSHRIDVPAGVDGLLGVGGGSAIDTAKAASAAHSLPLVSVPTTYSGAEWTPFFGVRDPDRRMVGGGGGAHLAGIVYDPELTLDLDRQTTVGTAMNALAHCAEALYVRGRSPAGDEHALAGARAIAEHLPRVVDRPRDLDERRALLEGAAHAGEALGLTGLALAHAMAQAVGGRYGLPHGTLNGICLPPALRFNAALVPDAIRAFGDAIRAPEDPASRVEELTALGGPTRLRDLGVPRYDLDDLAAAAATRRGNELNPRPATPAEIAELLLSAW